MEKDRVFFWCILFFLFGVGAGSFFNVSLSFASYLGAALFVALLVVFKNKEIIAAACCFLLFLFGASLSLQEKLFYDVLAFSSQEEEGIFRVLYNPEDKNFYQAVFLRTISCETRECPRKDILWQASLRETVRAGDRVQLKCIFEKPENFDPAFDYRMFLAKNSVGYICKKTLSAEVLARDTWGMLISSLFIPKRKIESALSQILPEPESGLAKGLLLGGNDYLPDSLQEKFSQIGLTHMVAVSGYNITLIAQGLLMLGLFFGLWRKQALWVAIIGVTLFIIMIGLPASALRAGVMAGIVFAALQAGRLSTPINALLLAAGLMLLFNPLLLRYDLGFQLSFLATLAIVLIVPFMTRFLPQGGFMKSLLEIVFITIAVELMVLPLILFSFHTFSPLVIVGNFLVIVVPYAMAFSFLSSLLFLFLPGSHIFFSWIAYFLLAVMTRSVEALGEIQELQFSVHAFGLKALLLWYAILFLAIMVFQKSLYSRKP